MKTFKNFLAESSNFSNKFGYDSNQFTMIKLWGALLYLGYDNLPGGPGYLNELKPHLLKYLQALEDEDDDEREELNDWFDEGAKMNGKALLTKNLVDKVFHSCEKEIDEELIVYKSGEKTHKDDRWISTSTKKGQYKSYGPEVEYKLPIGTKVIFADGIADKNEVIINTSELPK